MKNIFRNIIILLLNILLIILCISLKYFGYIDYIYFKEGDIFNIECSYKKNCNLDNNDGLYVYDNDIVWNSFNSLKIFSNSLYNYKNIIAPGSYNIYKFVINNKNSFDISYSISFFEENDNLINIKYKLRKNNVYILGNFYEWDDISSYSNTSFLDSNKYDIYLLEWKWIDSINDSYVGFTNSEYFLKLKIDAKNKDM